MLLGFIGTTELLLIGGLALLLFGGKKLPEMMRGLGKGVKEFKSGLNDDSQPKNGVGNIEDASETVTYDKVEDNNPDGEKRT